MQANVGAKEAEASPRLRLAARVGVVMADLASGVLGALPLLLLYLAGMHVWLLASGQDSDLVDEGSLPVAVVTPVLFLSLALVPAVIANLLLGSRTNWMVRTRLAIAIVSILGPFIASLIWPGIGGLFTGLLR